VAVIVTNSKLMNTNAKNAIIHAKVVLNLEHKIVMNVLMDLLRMIKDCVFAIRDIHNLLNNKVKEHLKLFVYQIMEIAQ